MITFIKEVVNNHCSFSSAFSTKLIMTTYSSGIKINSVNNSKSRECSASPSKYSSRESLVLLNTSSIFYNRKIKINNELLNEDFFNFVNSSQLSYVEMVKVDNLVSLITNK